MQHRLEGRDLLLQTIDEFLCTAHRQRRDVIDGLFGIELGALSADVGQRIDQMCLDAQQTQLEHLKQAARPGTDDDDFCVDDRAHA